MFYFALKDPPGAGRGAAGPGVPPTGRRRAPKGPAGLIAGVPETSARSPAAGTPPPATLTGRRPASHANPLFRLDLKPMTPLPSHRAPGPLPRNGASTLGRRRAARRRHTPGPPLPLAPTSLQRLRCLAPGGAASFDCGIALPPTQACKGPKRCIHITPLASRGLLTAFPSRGCTHRSVLPSPLLLGPLRARQGLVSTKVTVRGGGKV